MVRVRRAVCILSVSGLMAACSSGDQSGRRSVDEVSSPEFESPMVGECRGPMTQEIYDAVSDTRPTIACDQPHGSETFFVGPLPDEIAALPHSQLGELPEEFPAKDQMLRPCDEEYDQYVGVRPLGPDSFRPHNLSLAFYLPSAEQWEQGARWIRCDVVTRPFEGQADRSFPESLRGIVARDALPPGLRRCYREVIILPEVELLGLGSCDHAHQGEILVEFQVTDPGIDALGNDREALKRYTDDRYLQTCRERMTPMLGLSAAEFRERRDIKVGQAVLDLADWPADPTARRVWCLAVTEQLITGTVEGLGSNPLPT